MTHLDPPAIGFPAVGFIAPPGWTDPSPDEFPTVCADPVRSHAVQLETPDFDPWIGSPDRMEPEIAAAATALAKAGCVVAARTGPPFAWAGSLAGARARQDRIAAAARIGSVADGLAIVDALQALGARKVALACSYYTAPWVKRWADFVAGAGFEVGARTFADQGLWPEPGHPDRAERHPTDAETADHVRRMVAEFGHADAVAVMGAGARTLSLIRGLEAEIKRPVIGADTALYWAAAKAAGIALKPGALGALTEL